MVIVAVETTNEKFVGWISTLHDVSFGNLKKRKEDRNGILDVRSSRRRRDDQEYNGNVDRQ